MPSVGDIIRITSCKKLFDEDVCNVFYFAVAVWTGNLSIEDLLDQFQQAEVSATQTQLTNQLSFTEMFWKNLTNPAEAGEYIDPTPAIGLATGEAAPSFTAVKVQLVRTDLTTRHGFKRIGGVAEAYANGQNNANSTAWKDAVEAFMGATLQFGVDVTLDPVIVGRDAFGLPDLGRINPVLTAIVQDNLTTQNTRKAGRGS